MKKRTLVVRYHWIEYEPGDKVVLASDVPTLEWGVIYTVKLFIPPTHPATDPGGIVICDSSSIAWMADRFNPHVEAETGTPK